MPLIFLKSTFEESNLIKVDQELNQYVLSEKGRGYVYSEQKFSLVNSDDLNQ